MKDEGIFFGAKDKDGYYRLIARGPVKVELCKTKDEAIAIFIKRAIESYKDKVALEVIKAYAAKKETS